MFYLRKAQSAFPRQNVVFPTQLCLSPRKVINSTVTMNATTETIKHSTKSTVKELKAVGGKIRK